MSRDLIDLILPSLVQQMNNPDMTYDLSDAALVAGVCKALKINRAEVSARLKAYCHRNTTLH